MKFLAIDGNSLINRAFYGIRLLTTKDGRFTNAITGFLNIMLRLIDMENPDGIIVAWDLKAPTFRHKMYDEYKAGRKSMPPELFEQMEPLKNILCAFGCVCLEKEGFEADDILGTIAENCEKSGNECVIATGDRDSLQLVSDKTRVLLSTTKMGGPEIVVHTPESIFEKYGVSPKGLIEIKALQGDSSDNIPGVAGVGEKTAADLISRFNTIDNIYENIDSLDIKENLKVKLLNDKEKAFLSRTLGTIIKDAPISNNPADYILREKDTEKLSSYLYSLELFKIAERLKLEKVTVKETNENEKTAQFKIAENLPKSDIIYCVLYSENFGFCANETLVLLPLSDTQKIKEILENNTKKSVYDLKHIHKWCLQNDIKIKNVVFDSLLASYLLNPSSNSYSIDRLCAEYSIPEINLESDSSLAKDTALSYLISKKLSGLIHNADQEKLLTEIEIPLSFVLAEMEIEGFLIDKEEVENYGEILAEKLETLKTQIYNKAGEEFNINSPKQLGVVLFENLGIPCKKKTKSGYSTSADVLEELKYDYPIVADILEYRGLAKLKSTYCDGLSAATEQDGRIRCNLNQTETRTGRISSTEPNLQNIPVKKPEGRELRKFFIAKEGYCLIDADYSQIELRVLADISKDTAMINAFNNNVDIHTLTASQVFNMPENMVTPLMRSRAKAVNFGIVYGIGAFSLSKDIGVTRKEADSYIKGYLSTYAQVDEYMKTTVEKAKELGYCATSFNRKRFLPELKSSNHMLRSFGERVARNMPIQGTAADIIKIAMIKVRNRLLAEYPEAKLIMQVHDELLIEAPISDSEKVSEILKYEMENAVKLSVPLTVDVNCGKTWYDAKG